MKKLSIISFAFAIAVGSTTLTSCGGKNDSQKAETKIQDDQLKAFMLGGIYFENGYGGKSKTEEYVAQYGTDDETLLKTYNEVFVFPFKPEEASQIKPVLNDMWGIKDKASFLEMADELKKHTLKSSFTKSWDYARLVNVTALSYAVGYINKEEATKIVKEILPMAKAEYKTWDAYFADFAKGRNMWDKEETQDKKDFNALANTITKGEHNIYQMLPLN